jgi:cell division protease FtsH
MSAAGGSLRLRTEAACRSLPRGGRRIGPAASGGWCWRCFPSTSALSARAATGSGAGEVPFSPYFVTAVQAGQVASIASIGDTIQGSFKVAVRYPAQNAQAPPTALFSTEVPTFWNDNQLTALLESHHVEINASSPTPGTSLVGSHLFGFGPTLLLVGPFIAFARRAARGGAAGALGNFGRSHARRIDPATIRITFADVAGIDEAKAELTEIVDFLRNPDRYGRLGGRMPHGVLLSGAPGTGKTLIARAVAGEAHAAFFSISASEFIEAIVGVGAARVRDLFAKAKEAAPSIIFIDELDAIGRSRQGTVSVTGGHDERQQTLDQILTEMDGFESVEASPCSRRPTGPRYSTLHCCVPGASEVAGQPVLVHEMPTPVLP